MKRGTIWTDQEDKILLGLYDQANCFQKWKYISEQLRNKGVFKSETQCRQRFVNKLNPQLRKDKLETDELNSLFTYYDQYGPLWSVFETLIPGRSQNLLKNKFYSTLRSFIRLIFLTSPEKNQFSPNVSSTSLSSKLLVEIYEGKKNFRKFKGVLRKVFKKLDYVTDQEKNCDIEIIFGQELLNKFKNQIVLACKGMKVNEKVLENEEKKTRMNASEKKFSPKYLEQEKTEHPQLKKESTVILPQVTMPSFEAIPNFNIYYSSMMGYYYPVWNIGSGLTHFQN